jgi:hypothetical protein
MLGLGGVTARSRVQARPLGLRENHRMGRAIAGFGAPSRSTHRGFRGCFG